MRSQIVKEQGLQCCTVASSRLTRKTMTARLGIRPTHSLTRSPQPTATTQRCNPKNTKQKARSSFETSGLFEEDRVVLHGVLQNSRMRGGITGGGEGTKALGMLAIA